MVGRGEHRSRRRALPHGGVDDRRVRQTAPHQLRTAHAGVRPATDGGPRRGRHAVGAYLARSAEHVADPSVEPEATLGAGDGRVVVAMRAVIDSAPFRR